MNTQTNQMHCSSIIIRVYCYLYLAEQDLYLLSGYHGVGDLQLTSSPSLVYYYLYLAEQDSYLLSGYHGVADLQLTSSPSLLVVSAVSGTAFGPPSGRRGSREYLTADSGRRYGAYWTPKPTATNNKFLQVTAARLTVISFLGKE